MQSLKFFIFLSFLYLISPLACFVVCLAFYKNTISHIFFVFFAFYFGYFYPFDFDINNHYNDYLNFVGRSLEAIYADPDVYRYGTEPYHIILKYVLSRFSDSPNYFGGCVCAIYTALFIFFFRQFKAYYSHKQTFLNIALLLVVVLTVEFRWFQGVRFWPGIFYFAGFYLKYINTKNKLYLLLASLCPLFHLTLLTLDAVIILDYVMSKMPNFFRWVLFMLSIFVRSLNIDFVPFLLRLEFLHDYLKLAIINSEIRANDLMRIEEFRANANIYYTMRPYLGIVIGIIVLISFCRLKALTSSVHMKVLTFAFTLFTVANFGYGDIMFYERFTKCAILMFFSYLYIVSVTQSKQVERSSLILAILTCVVAFYFALTVLVEQRNYLFSATLIFGNFLNYGRDIMMMKSTWLK